MAKVLCLLINAFLLTQYVSAQPAKTAWAAANAGMGLGTTSVPDPTDHQINMAIVGINTAKTEAQAVQAAVALYNPALDMSDNVKQALENRVRQFRTPAGWSHPIPPPLPFGFDVMHLIMNAYYGSPVTSAPVAPIAPAAAGRPGPNPGPPTAIRRGPSPGNRRSGRIQQNAWQQPTNSWSAASTWDSGTGSSANTGNQQQGGLWQTNSQQQAGGADWTPLASSNAHWINPFDFYDPNANPSLWI